MPKVSLILAGAVSLGSFEAGVLDEILYVLDRLNRGRGEDDPYVIDSLAGASAGSMTAALVAQAVMRGFDKRHLLRRAWVDEIDITRLLPDIPPNALLNKTAIQEIGEEYLPYRGGDDAGPSSLAGETLRMAFTLSNMNGVDYRLPVSSGTTDRKAILPDHAGAEEEGAADRFVSTFFAERREFVLERDRPEGDDWTAVRAAAIASGNFPVAFTPARLPADEAQWPNHALLPFPASFSYVDGGMFNNEPVGEAVRLARAIDDPAAGARLDPERRFILIDANLNTSSHDDAFSEATTLLDTGKRLVTAMTGEATANDWLRALRRNNEVEWRDRMVELMARLVRDIEISDPEGFRDQLVKAGEAIVTRKREVLGGNRYGPGYREDAVKRLTEQFADHTVGMGPVRTAIFGNLVFLLNSVAGLDCKQHLNLSLIHTDGAEVAGNELHAFAGFFSHEWRLHDYTIGRIKARAALPTILGIRPEEMPDEDPTGVYRTDIDLSDVTMANAPPGARMALRDETMLKVKSMTRQLSLSGWWRALNRPARWVVHKLAKASLNAKLEL